MMSELVIRTKRLAHFAEVLERQGVPVKTAETSVIPPGIRIIESVVVPPDEAWLMVGERLVKRITWGPK